MTDNTNTNGTLYVVATPIGHLDDISKRAVDTLSTVSVIACEDTRETKKLLSHYGITTSCMSYHAQSDRRVEDSIIELLCNGNAIALVSDRGTPGISDPGQRLIIRAQEEGITVVPIPGASAVITALQGAGVHTSSFWFRGFIPHKKGRQTFLEQSIAHPDTVVFYESPHRILKTLEQSIALGIGDRHVVIARELTKLHEEFLRGTAEHIFDDLSARSAVQGEYVVIFDAL